MQGSSANGNGERGVRMVRVSGPGDIINGAGQLFAAGARQIQGARSVLVQRQPQVSSPCMLFQAGIIKHFPKDPRLSFSKTQASIDGLMRGSGEQG